jgi:hypothetical protein
MKEIVDISKQASWKILKISSLVFKEKSVGHNKKVALKIYCELIIYQ